MCRALGARALAVPTDVTREEDVRSLLEATLAHFSRIDVWVNNAAVTLVAPLDTAPIEEHRRVIETNMYGPIYAARALLPLLRAQRRGVIINVGSVLSKIGHAFVPSYVISKFALRGLSEALRVAVADMPDVHVCTLFPYAIDTPHFQTAGDFMGRQTFTMPPVQSPERVARAIVQLAQRPRRERHVPRIALLGLGLHGLMPRAVERLILHALQQWYLGPAQAPGQGDLFEPSHEPAQIHGRRLPRIGTWSLTLWALREFSKIEREALARALSNSTARMAHAVHGE